MHLPSFVTGTPGVNQRAIEAALLAVQSKIRLLQRLPADQWDVNYQLDYSQLAIYEERLSKLSIIRVVK